MEKKNIEYYFIITLANKEKNLHKIWLRTNENNFFRLKGKGIDMLLLKSIFETKLDDDFDALVFACSISHAVNEFMVYLESDQKVLYYSEVITVKDLVNKNNKESVFFNFDLKFQNSNNKKFLLPPKTSNLNPLNSFKILKSCFFEKNKNLGELFEFSMIYFNKNIDLLIELFNSIKEQEKGKYLCLFINQIEFKFLLFELLKNQNQLDEIKKILDDKKIEDIIMKNENGNNTEKNLLPEQIKFLKLKLIIYNEEKTPITTLELLNLYKILDSIESKTSLLDKELNYQISKSIREDFEINLLEYPYLLKQEKTNNLLEKHYKIDLITLLQHFWTKLQESINFEENLILQYQIQKTFTNNLFDSKLLDYTIISNTPTSKSIIIN